MSASGLENEPVSAKVDQTLKRPYILKRGAIITAGYLKMGDMMKIFLIFVIVWSGCLFAADLVINGQSNKTFQNQTYGHLSITSSSNITVKNCTFATSYATNGSGGVGDISRSNHITIDSCDFNGDTTTCTGMNVSGSFITIENCFIHDIADDGFQCNTGDHIYFYHNTICHLYGCGTDGGCGPCYNGHSDGFELGMLDSVELIGNLVYDVRSTSAVILDNWQGDSANVHNLLMENNIFYTPECGVVVYLFYVDGVKMDNNTIWKSNWLGVAVGPRVTRVEAYNNIVQCIDYTFLGGVYNASDHKYDYNLVGFTGRGLAKQAHDVVNADPKFRRIPIASDNTSAHVYRTVTPADFELMAGSQAIGAGTSAGGVPATDFYGRSRTVPYDMGAIKYESAGIRHANSSMRSSGTMFHFPSVVYAKHVPYNKALDRVDIYDLYGRKTIGIKDNNGCLFIKRPDGCVQRIVVVP